MSHRPNVPEDQFDIWLDAWVAGRSTPASRAASDSDTSEVRAAARQFHGLAHSAERSPAPPPFAPTWEDFMHAPTALPSPVREGQGTAPHPTVIPSLRGSERGIFGSSHTESSPSPHSSPLIRAVARWQPAVSLAVIIACLIGLVGIAYQRGVLVEQNPPDPSRHASQVLYDPADPSTFPQLPDACVSNGDVTPDEELATRSVADWPEPQYTPVQAITHEQGLAVQESFLRFLRCEVEAFSTATPDGGAWAIPPVVATPELLTYFSDRMRFDRLYPDLTPSQQADLDAYRCLPRIDTILNTFPMPVNEPVDIAMPPATIDVEPTYTLPVFAPSDVYLLPDGRYGAIVGSMSTAALTDPNAVTDNDHGRFFAFVEVDGRYYIDELFTIMASNLDWPIPNDRNGSMSTACD